MLNRSISLLALVTGIAVSGCGFFQPAGQSNLAVGVSPKQNLALQVAYADPATRVRMLNDAFKAAATDTVTFPFDSVELDKMAREALDGQAAWLRDNPDALMTIVGHTDLVGGEAYNNRLGMRRARAVASYLASRGVPRNRLLAAESRGKHEPVIQTEERERRNRRSVTVVSGTVQSGRGFGLDGELAGVIYDEYQANRVVVEKTDTSETTDQ